MVVPPKVVVIALGNRFRGDDGVGPSVADRLAGRLQGCEFIEGRNDALSIVNAWDGAELAVVVDAADSGASPGTTHRFEVDSEPLPKATARCSSHGLGLAEALELGKVLGCRPPRLVIYAIEVKNLRHGVGLSRKVAAAVEKVVRGVEADVALFIGANSNPKMHEAR